MKKISIATFLLCFVLLCQGQYYLRGEVKDEKGQGLQNVKILLKSTVGLYYSGIGGGFGINCTQAIDSITISLDGYETKSLQINSEVFQQITLKPLAFTVSKLRPKLISINTDRHFSFKYNWFVSEESYFSLVENETVQANKFPNTGFSLNINKASYSNIRRFLKTQSRVPPDAVRIEELLNYFNLHYTPPSNGNVFGMESQLTDCPWNKSSKLLLLNVNAKKLALDSVPPSNLVFLIDASGSMDLPNRLPLLKAAFQMLVKNLRSQDTVSIVLYGGMATTWLPPTGGDEKEKILKSIEEITADGDTPGESAIKMAYALANKHFLNCGNNRVILATDGDFNVGEVSEKALEELITREKKSGIYLTCLGVGMGNFKDSKLETLAKKGNGNYAYLDDLQEAEKVLVKEFTQTFFSVADNVFLNIQFDPSLVKAYRLIGFDNKKDAIADSTGELEGGEIGSGNSVLAIFEITPTVPDSALRIPSSTPLATVALKFTIPNKGERQQLKYACANNFLELGKIDKTYQFATALAMFGMRIRESKHFPLSKWSVIEKMAISSYDSSNYLQKEFITLIATAKKVYRKKKSSKED